MGKQLSIENDVFQNIAEIVNTEAYEHDRLETVTGNKSACLRMEVRFRKITKLFKAARAEMKLRKQQK